VRRLKELYALFCTYPYADYGHVATGLAYALALGWAGASDAFVLASALALATAKEYVYDRRVGKVPHVRDVATRFGGALLGTTIMGALI
jgi:hypothetical protein